MNEVRTVNSVLIFYYPTVELKPEDFYFPYLKVLQCLYTIIMTSNDPEIVKSMNIKDVASQTFLKEHTLRYYEKIGLISSVNRDSTSNYRVYSPETVETIEALACLRSTGMSIADMRLYLENMERGEIAATNQRQLFERNANRLANQIKQVRVQQSYITSKIDLWKAREEQDKTMEQAAVIELINKAKKLRDNRAR